VVEIVYGLRTAGPTVIGIDNVVDFSAGADAGGARVMLVTVTGEVVIAGEPTGVSPRSCPTGPEPGHGIIPLNRKTRASIPAPRVIIVKR
jgi:hypothetical protein